MLSGKLSSTLLVVTCSGIVTVGCGNSVPTVDAGADSAAAVGRAFTLSPIAVDEDGDAVTYQWTIETPAGSGVTLDDDQRTMARTTFTPDVVGPYTLTVVVNDGADSSDPDTITIAARVAPAVTVAMNGEDLAEDEDEVAVLPGTAVVLDAASSTVSQGLTAGFKWEVSSLPEDFEFEIEDEESSSLSFDFDEVGSYAFDVTVSDDEIETQRTITTHVRNAPVVRVTGANRILVGDSLTLDASESEVGPGGEAAYTWEVTGPPGSTATPADADSEIATFRPDVAGSYRVTLTIDDGAFTNNRMVDFTAVQ